MVNRRHGKRPLSQSCQRAELAVNIFNRKQISKTQFLHLNGHLISLYYNLCIRKNEVITYVISVYTFRTKIKSTREK